MRNEMENKNTSGNQVEENSAANTQQREKVVNTESLQGERNTIHEDQTNDYHEKTAELPSTNNDPTVYCEGGKEELIDKETETLHPYELPEVQIESNDSVGADINVQADSCQNGEGNVDQHVESTFDRNVEIHELPKEKDKSFLSDDDQGDDLVVEKIVSLKDRLNEEKYELIMRAGDQIGNGFLVDGEADETMEMNSHTRDTAVQYSEDVPQIIPSDFSATIPEPEEKCMDLTQEVNLMPNRTANAGKKCDHKRTEPSEQAFHELYFDDAAPSTIMKEDYIMKVVNVAKASDNASIQTDVSLAKHQHHVEQPIYAEEVFEMVAEKGTGPTKFISAFNNHEQMETSIVAREGRRVEESCSAELVDKCILQLGTFKSGNDVCVESSSFSLSSRYPDGMMQGSDTAEVWNVGITHLKGQTGCELSIQRFSLESNLEKSGDETEIRKSPSFDFGVSYDAKSEETDQTPLLYTEKTLTRSLSLGSHAKFSNLTKRAEYAGSLLEYEKTNRMERSDYQVSQTPCLGLLKTGQNSESKAETDSKTSTTKELPLNSPKGGGKRQPRPSFFSSCICCTTAIR